jgi:hypothetical protein
MEIIGLTRTPKAPFIVHDEHARDGRSIAYTPLPSSVRITIATVEFSIVTGNPTAAELAQLLFHPEERLHDAARIAGGVSG